MWSVRAICAGCGIESLYRSFELYRCGDTLRRPCTKQLSLIISFEIGWVKVGGQRWCGIVNTTKSKRGAGKRILKLVKAVNYLTVSTRIRIRRRRRRRRRMLTKGAYFVFICMNNKMKTANCFVPAWNSWIIMVRMLATRECFVYTCSDITIIFCFNFDFLKVCASSSDWYFICWQTHMSSWFTSLLHRNTVSKILHQPSDLTLISLFIQRLVVLLCILEIPVSSLDRVAAYIKRGCSWFSSICPTISGILPWNRLRFS